MRTRIRLLEAASRDGRATSYDALALRRELDRSVVAADKARELSAALTKAIAAADDALKQKDTLLASIDASPYRLAIDGDVALGFVPYENLPAATSDSTLVACRTTLLFCHPVGTVGEALAGEVRGVPPLDGRDRRGQLVRLTLTEPRAAERTVLYAGHGPLDW